MKQSTFRQYQPDGDDEQSSSEQEQSVDVEVDADVLTMERLKRHYYKEKKSQSEIGEMYNIRQSEVSRVMRAHGLKTRGNGGTRTKDASKNPASFYTCTTRGYEYAAGTSQRGTDWPKEEVPIHRLVAIAEYGFEAVVGNDVHHINGIGWDNRATNLYPMSREQHLRQHWHEKPLMTAMKKADEREIYHCLEATGNLDLLNGGVD